MISVKSKLKVLPSQSTVTSWALATVWQTSEDHVVHDNSFFADKRVNHLVEFSLSGPNKAMALTVHRL